MEERSILEWLWSRCTEGTVGYMEALGLVACSLLVSAFVAACGPRLLLMVVGLDSAAEFPFFLSFFLHMQASIGGVRCTVRLPSLCYGL